MSESQSEVTKANIDMYLKELGKEYRKRVGKSVPAELIIIGGASILINYGFRDITMDVDAIIRASSSMKDAINSVGNRFNLPHSWLNADFCETNSFSPKLEEFSVYYRTFSNVLTIRTVSAEYLIAMKLRSGRQYKRDFSDVLGILAEHKRRGTPITLEQIHKATSDLYGNWSSLPEASQAFVANAIKNGDYEQLYLRVLEDEKETKELLIQFELDYPSVTAKDNVDGIAETLQQKTDKASLLAQLRQM